MPLSALEKAERRYRQCLEEGEEVPSPRTEANRLLLERVRAEMAGRGPRSIEDGPQTINEDLQQSDPAEMETLALYEGGWVLQKGRVALIKEALQAQPPPPPLPPRGPPVPLYNPRDIIVARGTLCSVLLDDGDNVRAKRCSDGVIKNFDQEECRRL